MNKILLIAFALFAAGLTGCGLQEDEGDEGTDIITPDATPPDDDAGPADDTLPAPFRSPAANVYDFSTAYVSGATCGEVRGNLPGLSWTEGVQIANPDGDGYMGMSFIVPAGTYELSYLGWQNCDSREPRDAWAQYGFEEQLTKMTAEARSFINCNWWNATTQQKVTGTNPSCDIRITVDTVGNILPAGNMANFVGL